MGRDGGLGGLLVLRAGRRGGGDLIPLVYLMEAVELRKNQLAVLLVLGSCGLRWLPGACSCGGASCFRCAGAVSISGADEAAATAAAGVVRRSGGPGLKSRPSSCRQTHLRHVEAGLQTRLRRQRAARRNPDHDTYHGRQTSFHGTSVVVGADARRAEQLIVGGEVGRRRVRARHAAHQNGLDFEAGNCLVF